MRRVIYTSVVLAASILLGLDMLNQAAARPADPVATITLILMGLGFCIMSFGLYLERHKAGAYLMRRREIRRRMASRAIIFRLRPRHVARLRLPAVSAG